VNPSSNPSSSPSSSAAIADETQFEYFSLDAGELVKQSISLRFREFERLEEAPNRTRFVH